MPEFSELQQLVLTIVNEHTNKDFFGKGECLLTNQQIFELIPSGLRPYDDDYITSVLKRLESKKKLILKTKFMVGQRGKKRTITIL